MKKRNRRSAGASKFAPVLKTATAYCGRQLLHEIRSAFVWLTCAGNAQSQPANKPKVFGNGVGTNKFVQGEPCFSKVSPSGFTARAKVLPQRGVGQSPTGARTP